MPISPASFINFVRSNWNGDRNTIHRLVPKFFTDSEVALHTLKHDMTSFMDRFGFRQACIDAYYLPDGAELDAHIQHTFINNLYKQHIDGCSSCNNVFAFVIDELPNNQVGIRLTQNSPCFKLDSLKAISFNYELLSDAINKKVDAGRLSTPVIHEDVLNNTKFETDNDGNTDGDCYFTIERELVLINTDIPKLALYVPIGMASPRRLTVKFQKTYHTNVCITSAGTDALEINLTDDFSTNTYIALHSNSKVALNFKGDAGTTIDAEGDIAFVYDNYEVMLLESMNFNLNDLFADVDAAAMLKARLSAQIRAQSRPTPALSDALLHLRARLQAEVLSVTNHFDGKQIEAVDVKDIESILSEFIQREHVRLARIEQLSNPHKI